MNQTSLNKIEQHRSQIFHIDANRYQYEGIIDMLDEPYQTALLILEYPNIKDDHEIAMLTGLNWQTVKQVRKALFS